MRMIGKTHILIAAVVAAGLTAPGIAAAQEAVRIGTSSVGSVFYTIAIGASEIIQKHAKLNTNVEPVGGSAASLNSLGAKKIEFALANSFTVAAAYTGEGRFKNPITTRLIVVGQPNYRALVVRKGAGINSAADLKGKVIVGKRRALPENEMVMNAILKVNGLAPGDIRNVGTTNSPQVYKALRAGSVDGAIVPFSRRSPAIEKPFQDGVIEFFDLAKGKRDAAMKFVPKAFFPHTFKLGDFTAQKRPVHVFGLSTYFVTRPDMADEMVYRVAKAIMDNNKEFATYHRAARLWNAKRTAAGFKIPVHPGSVRYLKEKGLWTGAHEARQKKLLGG